MPAIEVRPLDEKLSFGACVSGVTRDNLKDPAVRAQLNRVFEERGVIHFVDVEPSAEMQVEISLVFGPLKEHPVASVERADSDKLLGVIAISSGPHAGVVEIDGKQLATWQPWHFDHAYNNELNRAGVLRSLAIATDGGQTGFADGIQIYRDMDPALRAEAERIELLYTLDLRYSQQWFGLPDTFKEIVPKGGAILEMAKSLPRAIHPAVWHRKSGETVLHMSPYGCRGIVGQETPEGNALLVDIWNEVERTIIPYYHDWKPTDMLVWDNWRMLHMACGADRKFDREVHRTTIKGDYGLGRWETEPKEAAVSADAMG